MHFLPFISTTAIKIDALLESLGQSYVPYRCKASKAFLRAEIAKNCMKSMTFKHQVESTLN